MRPWTIPIVAAIALSLAAPPTASARPRGPAALLGVVAAPLGAVLGGSRHSFRHQRRSATRPPDQRGEDDARGQRPSIAPAAPAVFWPDAFADLIDYLFFPTGRDDRFWAYDYGTIVGAAFASGANDARVARARRLADGAAEPAQPQQPDWPAGLCDSGAADADALVERIGKAIQPSASQRRVLEELRTASAQAAERISDTCPTTVPATLAQRLKAIQDRIWAMRDALLTIRLPLEKLYGSLSGEQLWRLQRDPPDARETDARPANARSPICGGPEAAEAQASMRAIERAVRPSAAQRASFEALRLSSAAMAQLIAGSCPTYPLLGHMGRFAAAADRLDVMLFAVMTVSPALQDFYNSLDDRQKQRLGRALRRLERSPGAAGGSS